MQPERKTPKELEALAVSALEEAAAQLRQVLVELAFQLRPFPAFLNMVSIQAMEMEPALRPLEDRGCVVVCPNGEIRRLELTGIPGAPGLRDVEQVEQFNDLDLPIEEYIIYATAAVGVLAKELKQHGG